jgi:hypothetical protein
LINVDGRCKTAVGGTVEVENAPWTNTIGSTELIAGWQAQVFDPALRGDYPRGLLGFLVGQQPARRFSSGHRRRHNQHFLSREARQ